MGLDPEIRSFAEESDRLFDADYARLPMAEQRRLYNGWCERFSAPLPADVVSAEHFVPAAGAPVRVRLFAPRDAAGPLPVIVFYHGGGWIFGSPETHAMTTAEIARRTGAAVVSVDYRLAPEHAFPAAFEDALAVLAWVAESGPARKVGGVDLDGSRIAVCGDSAGANLAAAVALAARDRNGPRLALQALIYPALRVKRRTPPVGDEDEVAFTAYVEAYAGGADKIAALARNPYAMPLAAADFRALPPAIIAAAGVDSLLEDAQDYAAALKGAGVAVTYRCATGLPHSYLRCIHISPRAVAELDAVCGALARALGATPQFAAAASSASLMAG